MERAGWSSSTAPSSQSAPVSPFLLPPWGAPGAGVKSCQATTQPEPGNPNDSHLLRRFASVKSQTFHIHLTFLCPWHFNKLRPLVLGEKSVPPVEGNKTGTLQQESRTPSYRLTSVDFESRSLPQCLYGNDHTNGKYYRSPEGKGPRSPLAKKSYP